MAAAGEEKPTESREREASAKHVDHLPLDRAARMSSPSASPEAAAASNRLPSGPPSPEMKSAASPGLAPTAAEQDEHDVSNDSFDDPAIGYPVGDVKDEPLDVPVEDPLD